MDAFKVDHSRNGFAHSEWQYVDHSGTTRVTGTCFWHFVRFEAVCTASRRKEQQCIMRANMHNLCYIIVFLRLHANNASATFMLVAIYVRVHPFDVTLFSQGNNHLFVSDEVFYIKVGCIDSDFRTTRIAVFFLHIFQFIFDDLTLTRFASQDSF